MVVFEGVFVNCIWEDRCDIGLFKPVRENTFTEEKISDIGVRRTSRHSLMIRVGQGSKSHDFVGDFDMRFLTFSSVNCWKQRSGDGV